MCGRYVRKSDKQKIAEHFAVHGPSVPDFGPSWNVAPQTFQPVVRLSRDTGERELVLMRWGLIPIGPKTQASGCARSTPRQKRLRPRRLSGRRSSTGAASCPRTPSRVAEAGPEDQATVRHRPQEQRALCIRWAVGEMKRQASWSEPPDAAVPERRLRLPSRRHRQYRFQHGTLCSSRIGRRSGVPVPRLLRDPGRRPQVPPSFLSVPGPYRNVNPSVFCPHRT